MQQCEGIVVDRICDAVFERDSWKLGCAWQCNFDGPRSVFSEEGKLTSGQRLPLLQGRCDDAIDAADVGGGLLRFFVVVLPFARHGIAEVEPFDGLGEIAHEVGASQFPVGEDVEPDFLLTLENPEDVPVLDGLEV